MSDINPAIFKAYDIRALYPDGINEEVMVDAIRAIYTFMSKKLKKRDISVALGHDMRLSSPSLYKVAAETLVKCGAKVKEIGLATTPTVYFAVRQHQFDTGIQISASHNPKDYNGLKLVIRDGDKLIKIGKMTGMLEIRDLAMNGDFAEYIENGSMELVNNVLEEEVSQAFEAIKPGDAEGLKIVADPANAMGILPLKSLFAKLKATPVTINYFLDGTFPAHQADPLQYKTLRQLQDTVIAEKGDIGIAIDGDGDRVMFIDNRGDIIPATYITALIAREILKDTPHARILVDIRYVRNVKKIVESYGGEVGYTKIGHALITEQVNREGAAFAGESSGHFYFQSMGGCESSIRVILYMLRILAEEKRPIAEVIDSIRSSFESGESNFKLSSPEAAAPLIEQIKTEYADGVLSTLDGIAIDYDTWRFSIRTSNTEPLLRLNVEGESLELVQIKVAELTAKIVATGAHLEE